MQKVTKWKKIGSQFQEQQPQLLHHYDRKL